MADGRRQAGPGGAQPWRLTPDDRCLQCGHEADQHDSALQVCLLCTCLRFQGYELEDEEDTDEPFRELDFDRDGR